MKFDFAFVFVFGLSLSAKEAFGQDSCMGNSQCNSNGCTYGYVAGNAKLTVTNCAAEFSFISLSGSGEIDVPSSVTSVTGSDISGSGCLATESSGTSASAPTSGSGRIVNGGSCGLCIAGDNPLWSCTKDQTVLARDVSIGDSIRVAAAKEDGGMTCSDVYYVYHHGGLSPALRFHVTSDDQPDKTSSLSVSRNHILYVGTSFEDRLPVLSQEVVPGDNLVTSKGHVHIVKIETDFVDMVNVLTVDPHLEIQTGNDGSGEGNVIISAHSNDEEAYGRIFAPVKYAYWAFGPNAVEYMKPMFDYIDASMTKPGTIRAVADKMLYA